MTITDLIRELTTHRNIHGDINVFIANTDRSNLWDPTIDVEQITVDDAEIFDLPENENILIIE